MPLKPMPTPPQAPGECPHCRTAYPWGLVTCSNCGRGPEPFVSHQPCPECRQPFTHASNDSPFCPVCRPRVEARRAREAAERAETERFEYLQRVNPIGAFLSPWPAQYRRGSMLTFAITLAALGILFSSILWEWLSALWNRLLVG